MLSCFFEVWNAISLSVILIIDATSDSQFVIWLDTIDIPGKNYFDKGIAMFVKISIVYLLRYNKIKAVSSKTTASFLTLLWT